MAIEFFTDVLLNPYIEDGSPAEQNWVVTAFSGNTMTIQTNGESFWGGPSFSGWVRYAGNISEFPQYVEATFTTNPWAYISNVEMVLFREIGNWNTTIFNETFVGSNENGLGYPSPPSGGGPYTYHFEPVWQSDDPLFDGTYESLTSTGGFLMVTIQPRSDVSPTIQFSLGEYLGSPDNPLFWTSYVKTREKFLT